MAQTIGSPRNRIKASLRDRFSILKTAAIGPLADPLKSGLDFPQELSVEVGLSGNKFLLLRVDTLVACVQPA